MAGSFLICDFGVHLRIPTRLLKCDTVFQYWSLFTIFRSRDAQSERASQGSKLSETGAGNCLGKSNLDLKACA
jgi:hypothetical protein